MADEHNSPTALTAMPPVITLDRPSISPQTLSPTLPPSASMSMSSSSTKSMSSQANECTTLAPIATPMASMLSISSMTPVEHAKKPFDISSLMSPPEPTLFDSFSNGQGSVNSQIASKAATHGIMLPRPQAPMSPPVSPFNKAESNASVVSVNVGPPTPSNDPVKDPILYPPQDSTPSPPQRPLFEPMDVDEHERLVDAHIASRSPDLFRRVSPPRLQEYELTLYFKAQLMETYMNNYRGWLKRNRDQLLADRRAVAKVTKARLPKLLPARTSGAAVSLSQSVKVPRPPRPDKVTKPMSSKLSSSTPRPIRTHPAPPRAVRVSATPEPRRIVAPNREDKKFNELPDYCPPITSLPDKPNCLKVDWKGAPIDLTGDPHAHLLHLDEVSLAANLRLDCATYLTSKRRIFMRRLECAKVGKEFRKTDAQQACKIDVNKASKLWTAFEKVGWLDLHWMKIFMV